MWANAINLYRQLTSVLSAIDKKMVGRCRSKRNSCANWRSSKVGWSSSEISSIVYSSLCASHSSKVVGNSKARQAVASSRKWLTLYLCPRRRKALNTFKGKVFTWYDLWMSLWARVCMEDASRHTFCTMRSENAQHPVQNQTDTQLGSHPQWALLGVGECQTCLERPSNAWLTRYDEREIACFLLGGWYCHHPATSMSIARWSVLLPVHQSFGVWGRTWDKARMSNFSCDIRGPSRRSLHKLELRSV